MPEDNQVTLPLGVYAPVKRSEGSMAPLSEAQADGHGRLPHDEPGVHVSNQSIAAPATDRCESSAIAAGVIPSVHDEDDAAPPPPEAATDPQWTSLLSLAWAAWRTMTFASVLLGSGAFLLFVVSQASQTLASLLLLPLPLQIAGYAVLGILSAAISLSLGLMARTYLRFRSNNQLQLSKLLHNKPSLRARMEAQSGAIEGLRSYLANYPVASADQLQYLEACGLNKEELRSLRQEKDSLLSEEIGSSRTWLEAFDGRFQGVLDRAAEFKVKEAARSLAIRTALSPNPLIDSLLVLHGTFQLTVVLCRIYNLRAGPLATVRLAATAFSQAYFAGRVEEMPLDAWIGDAVNNALAKFSGCNLPVVGNLAGSLGGPAVQGLVNGALVARIGRQTRMLLRPLDIDG